MVVKLVDLYFYGYSFLCDNFDLFLEIISLYIMINVLCLEDVFVKGLLRDGKFVYVFFVITIIFVILFVLSWLGE